MSRISSNKEKVQAFIVLYVLMAGLWMLGHFLGTDVFVKKIQTLNSFECPSNGEIRNEYDCTRFNLEKGSKYPFFFQTELPLLDLNITVNIFRQTGQRFNEDKTETITASLEKLFLDSDGKVQDIKPTEITLTFECKANTWICGPATLINENRFPAGKHYYVLDFKDHEELWKRVRNAEVIMENFDQTYQQYIIYFKLVMLIVSLIGGGLYYGSLKKVGRNIWSTEQTWVLFLTGAVICFNDPFSLLYYSYGIGLLLFLSRLSLIVGLSLVTPFWIATLRSLRYKQSSRFLTLQESTYASVGVFFATICTLFLADTPSFIFTVSKLYNFITAIAMIYQVIQDLVNFRMLLWVDKLFILVTLYFATAYFGLTFGWQTPMDAYSRNFAKSLAVISLFTVYSLMCQYLYAPRKESGLKSGMDLSISERKAYDKLEEDAEKDDYIA